MAREGDDAAASAAEQRALPFPGLEPGRVYQGAWDLERMAGGTATAPVR